jgi:transposase
MPTAYGMEFRQDVVGMPREGEAPLAQIAKDSGLSVTTLKRWIASAKRKDFGAPRSSAHECLPRSKSKTSLRGTTEDTSH